MGIPAALMPSARPAAQYACSLRLTLLLLVQDAASLGAQHASSHSEPLNSSSKEQVHQGSPPWRDSGSHPPLTDEHPGSPVDNPIHR